MARIWFENFFQNRLWPSYIPNQLLYHSSHLSTCPFHLMRRWSLKRMKIYFGTHVILRNIRFFCCWEFNFLEYCRLMSNRHSRAKRPLYLNSSICNVASCMQCADWFLNVGQILIGIHYFFFPNSMSMWNNIPYSLLKFESSGE